MESSCDWLSSEVSEQDLRGDIHQHWRPGGELGEVFQDVLVGGLRSQVKLLLQRVDSALGGVDHSEGLNLVDFRAT